MDIGTDYPWINEMFIFIICGAVHYSWIAKIQIALFMDSAKYIHRYYKRNLYYPWIVEYIHVFHNKEI